MGKTRSIAVLAAVVTMFVSTGDLRAQQTADSTIRRQQRTLDSL